MKHVPKTAGERQSHAFAGSRQQPRDAQAMLPIDGSQLYGEGEGRMSLLFPMFDPSGVFLGRLTLAQGATRIRCVGHTLAVIDMPSSTLVAASQLTMQFMKNGQPVSDPLPISLFSTTVGFEPVSPIGARSFVTNTFFGKPSVAPIFQIEFDELIFQNNTGGSTTFNAIIAQGRAQISW